MILSSMKKRLLAFFVAVFLILLVLVVLVFTSDRKTMTVTTPSGDIVVYVADTPASRTMGLSGTTLDKMDAEGMIFLFSEQKEQRFWMYKMNYNVDVLWIKDKKIMKIDRDVPAPKEGEDPVYMYSKPFKVDAVLELPAGGADEYGLVIGHVLGF